MVSVLAALTGCLALLRKPDVDISITKAVMLSYLQHLQGILVFLAVKSRTIKDEKEGVVLFSEMLGDDVESNKFILIFRQYWFNMESELDNFTSYRLVGICKMGGMHSVIRTLFLINENTSMAGTTMISTLDMLDRRE